MEKTGTPSSTAVTSVLSSSVISSLPVFRPVNHIRNIEIISLFWFFLNGKDFLTGSGNFCQVVEFYDINKSFFGHGTEMVWQRVAILVES